MKPWFEGKVVGVREFEPLEEAVGVYAKETRETCDRLRRTTPPKDPRCKDFHELIVSFAALKEAQLPEIEKTVSIMKRLSPPNETDLRTVVDLFRAMEKPETDLENEIIRRQHALAKEFGLKIRNPKK